MTVSGRPRRQLGSKDGRTDGRKADVQEGEKFRDLVIYEAEKMDADGGPDFTCSRRGFLYLCEYFTSH